jgi:hypothetical protein
LVDALGLGLDTRLRYHAAMSIEPMPPDDLAGLYRQAFARYGTRALWNRRPLERPTREDALVVARALRIEGDRVARRLAERIEAACRAAL